MKKSYEELDISLLQWFN